MIMLDRRAVFVVNRSAIPGCRFERNSIDFKTSVSSDPGAGVGCHLFEKTLTPGAASGSKLLRLEPLPCSAIR
jgi:hypothetical protein